MSLPAFQRPLQGRRFRIEPAPGDDGKLSIVRLADELVVGSAVLDEPAPGTLQIQELCVDEQHRGYGAGSEAAELILAAADAAGIVVSAWAPPHLGLAVYFWVRMGLSPLHGEGPNGGIWFERRTGLRPPG